jgi:magnesium transporter
MLTIYDLTGGKLARRDGLQPISGASVWIDLYEPTVDEEHHVEAALGIEVPTRAEMREIEASSRLYQENGAHYMTAFVVHNIEKPQPDTNAFTFILSGQHLVTVRYAESKAMAHFLAHVDKGEAPVETGAHVLMGLVESVIQQIADLTERLQDDVDELAKGIFDIKGGQATRSRRHDVMLKGVGRAGDIVSRAQESARSLERMLNFFKVAARDRGCDAKLRERISASTRDVHSLTEHMTFLAERATFLLNATLGMISTEQNQIIKLFSVMAVALMPPTLIASVYGMNFKHMPELEWLEGYPMALGLMLLSAAIPFVYFKRKGWL